MRWILCVGTLACAANAAGADGPWLGLFWIVVGGTLLEWAVEMR